MAAVVLSAAAADCRLDAASLQAGVERPVAGASGVAVAAVRSGRVAFVRMRDHVPTLWLGELSAIAGAREPPLLDPQHASALEDLRSIGTKSHDKDCRRGRARDPGLSTRDSFVDLRRLAGIWNCAGKERSHQGVLAGEGPLKHQ
jgi:hypothetical protein